MEDLRESYNVNKGGNGFLTFMSFIFTNRKLLTGILTIGISVFVLFFPHLIGKYTSMWINQLYTSFMEYNAIGLETWAISMGTVLMFILFYGLLKWINRY